MPTQPLTGAALIGLPILLHLIMRQKPKRLQFPAFRFLLQKHRTNQRSHAFVELARRASTTRDFRALAELEAHGFVAADRTTTA